MVPDHGAFFALGFKMYDENTDRLLIFGEDYRFTELEQDASLKCGKEIYTVVLILNQTVSQNIRISEIHYVGDKYSVPVKNIGNIYSTVMSDNRPVDWINVLNRPDKYPPQSHMHPTFELYGFESLVYVLERIRSAILLSNIPAFEEILKIVDEKIRNLRLATYADIDIGISNNNLITVDTLFYALHKHCPKYKLGLITSYDSPLGVMSEFEVTSLEDKEGELLYWSVTPDTLGLTPANGFGTVFNGKLVFQVDMPVESIDAPFRVELREKSYTNFIVASLTDVKASSVYQSSELSEQELMSIVCGLGSDDPVYHFYVKD